MKIDPADLDARGRYALLIGCVVPRPIAWLSTLSAGGAANLAPFSFFGGVTSDPPTVVVSIGRRRGAHKDSARNMLETGEAVIHIPTRALAEKMVATSAEVAPEVDEFDLGGLTKLPSERVRPYRIEEAVIAMEARVERHLEIGNARTDTFFLEILLFHFAEGILEAGLPKPEAFAAVGRLGGAGYADTSAPFFIPRPK